MQTKHKNKVKIALDVVMALVFAILFNKTALGGLLFHEIAGLAVGAFIIFHKILNWAWIKGVTKKLLDKKLPGRTRLAYFVDILLLVSILIIIITGILISKVLFANIINVNLNLSGLHRAVSYIALLLIGVHVGLSWERVIAIMKKLMKIPKKKALGAVATACALIVFSLGSYNIVSTNYFSKVASITSAFSERGGGEHSFSGSESGDEAGASALSKESESAITVDAVSSASLNSVSTTSDIVTADSELVATDGFGGNRQQGKGFGGNGEMRGKSDSNVLSTIYQNLSIISAFAVFMYYIDKFLRRKPKRTGAQTAE